MHFSLLLESCSNLKNSEQCSTFVFCNSSARLILDDEFHVNKCLIVVEATTSLGSMRHVTSTPIVLRTLAW